MNWVRQGPRKTPKTRSARVVAVHLFPDKLILRPGQKHSLQLIAVEYNDGSKRDVTRLAVFTANINDRYAGVEDEGVVVAGEARRDGRGGPVRAEIQARRASPSCCSPPP